MIMMVMLMTWAFRQMTCHNNDHDGDVRNDEDIKPDDSDADPGVTVSPIVARWQVCRALNRNC